MGVSRYAASEFSFLLAVPMMMGATVLDLYKSMGFLTTGDIPMFAVGFITAFIVALIAIKTFLHVIKRISFIPFAIYRFIVAAVVYLVFYKTCALTLSAEGSCSFQCARAAIRLRVSSSRTSAPLKPASITSLVGTARATCRGFTQ